MEIDNQELHETLQAKKVYWEVLFNFKNGLIFNRFGHSDIEVLFQGIAHLSLFWAICSYIYVYLLYWYKKIYDIRQASTLTQNDTGPIGPVTPSIYWSCEMFTGPTFFL